jgi:hypothetical protein
MAELNIFDTGPGGARGQVQTPYLQVREPGYNYGDEDGFLEFGSGQPGSLPFKVDQDGNVTAASFSGGGVTGSLLQPSGDTTGNTDTANILTASQNGQRLAPGTFYVKNIALASYGVVEGSGPGTILSVVSGTTGAVFTLATPSTTRYTYTRNLTIACNSRASLEGIHLDNTGLSPSTPGFHTQCRLFIQTPAADGYHLSNIIETITDTVKVINGAAVNFNIENSATDGRFDNCTSAASGSYGVYASGSNNRYTNFKVYYAGYNGTEFTGSIPGWYVASVADYFTAGVGFVNCEAQDCGGPGWQFDSSLGPIFAMSLVGSTIDSCNAFGATGAMACGIVTDAFTYGTITGNNIFNREGGAGTMAYYLSVDNVETELVAAANGVKVANSGVYYVTEPDGTYGYTLIESFMTDLSGTSETKLGSPVLAPAAPQALSSASTITTGANQGSYPVTAAGNVTGVIMAAGAFAGQTLIVVNQSAFTVTFAAAGTSNVADGVSDVIPALTARTFTWDANTDLWYRGA